MNINCILALRSVPDIVEQSGGWKGQRWSECLKRNHWFNVTVNAFVVKRK